MFWGFISAKHEHAKQNCLNCTAGRAVPVAPFETTERFYKSFVELAIVSKRVYALGFYFCEARTYKTRRVSLF